MDRCFKSLLFVAVVAFGAIALPSRAEALSKVFTDNSNNPSSVTMALMVAEADGASVLLDAQVTEVKVFTRQTSGNVDITIEGACDGRFNAVGNDDIRVTVKGIDKTNTGGDCAGDGNLHFNNIQVSDFANKNGGEEWYGQFRYVTVTIRKINGVGIKSFKVRADGVPDARVTFDDGGGVYWKETTRPPVDAFALWNASNSGGAHDENAVDFEFMPKTCNYTSGDDVYLKWFDADFGQPNEIGGISWQLVDMTASPNDPVNVRNLWNGNNPGSVVSNGNLGDGGQYGWANVGPLKIDHVYRWRWSGVDKINGIQIWMPFSEISKEVDCGGTPPTPISVNPDCRVFRRNIFDQSTVRYRFVYYPMGLGVGTPSNNPNNTNHPNPSYSSLPATNRWNDYGPGALKDDKNINRDDAAYVRSISGNVYYEQNMPPPVAQGYRVIMERWLENSSGNWEFWSTQIDVPNCYSASCDFIRINYGLLRPDYDVPANGAFGSQYSLDSTGSESPLPALLNGRRLGLRVVGASWGGAAAYSNAAGNRVDLGLTAPADISAHTLIVEPRYLDGPGDFIIGPQCAIPINVFQKYDFEVSATSVLNPDNENPASASLTTNVAKTGTADVDATASVSWFKRRATTNTPIGGPFNEFRAFVHTVPYRTDLYAIPPGSFVLGDGYCASINLDRGHGWRGPGNVYIYNTSDYDDNCAAGEFPKVEAKPYVRSYGADVMAGGGFGTDCSRTNSGILAYISPLGTQQTSDNSGSGTSLAAFALGPISGYMSAAARQTGAQSPQGLTFSHTNTLPTQTGNNPLLGGNMTGDGWCSPDYYEATQFTDNSKKTTNNSNSPLSIMGLNNGEQTVKAISGAMIRIQSSNAANYNRQHTVYVDGDAFISNNIMYDQSVYNSLDTIPSFTLVVKGNIYIDRDVSQLDGLYIAQPRSGDPNSGRIYTCALGAPSYTPVTNRSQIFTECGGDDAGSRRQLTINGAFVAQRVILNRAGYTLRDSTFREQYSPAAKAAETFVFSPEMYLSPPVFRPTGTATGGDYQSIQILAPFL